MVSIVYLRLAHRPYDIPGRLSSLHHGCRPPMAGIVSMVKQVHNKHDRTRDLVGHNPMAQSNDNLNLQLSSRISLDLIRTEDECLHLLQTSTPPPGHLFNSSSKTLIHNHKSSPSGKLLQINRHPINHVQLHRHKGQQPRLRIPCLPMVDHP